MFDSKWRDLHLNAQNQLITKLVHHLTTTKPLPVKKIYDECVAKGITFGVATNAILKLSKSNILSLDTKKKTVEMTNFGKWICKQKLYNFTLEELEFKYTEKKKQKNQKNKDFRNKKKNEEAKQSESQKVKKGPSKKPQTLTTKRKAGWGRRRKESFMRQKKL